MVAVAVLIVVILATARIFGTASKVTGLSEAATDVLQEAGAIERQVRGDFERLSHEGFLAIRCVAVANNINLPAGGPLLDPTLPLGAWVRADQILLFTQGAQSVQTYRQGEGTQHKGQGAAARVYYGHAFQVPDGPAADDSDPAEVLAFDPAVVPAIPMVPWYWGNRDFVRTSFPATAGNDYATQGGLPQINARQPPAARWVLARQAVVLADDGGAPSVFLGENRSADRIDHPVILNGRVDAAASQLEDIRGSLTMTPTGQRRPWFESGYSGGDQRTLISGLLSYPRSERVAPSPHRVDQALTNNVLASACSSFSVDWTWEDGVGDVLDPIDPFGQILYQGARVDPSAEQPWFGLDPDDPADPHGFRAYAQALPGNMQPQTIFPDNIELLDTTPPVIVYEAFFGYNQSEALDNTGQPNVNLGYTPWPTAIRITMRLHDTTGRLARGREVQFVVDLPRRAPSP
jgi:hypothetical protein